MQRGYCDSDGISMSAHDPIKGKKSQYGHKRAHPGLSREDTFGRVHDNDKCRNDAMSVLANVSLASVIPLSSAVGTKRSSRYRSCPACARNFYLHETKQENRSERGNHFYVIYYDIFHYKLLPLKYNRLVTIELINLILL